MRKSGRRGDKIGRLSANIIFLSLQFLKNEGKILGFVRVDNPGEDFIVTLLDGQKQPLEVKSSIEGKKLHQQHYGDQAAPAVVVRNFRAQMPEDQKRRFAFAMKKYVMEALVQKTTIV